MAKASFTELISGRKPTLVDFYADWCGPCKMMKPIRDDLKQRVGDRARIIKIDVDKNPELAAAYQVQGVPTLAIFSDGQLKWRQSGVQQAAVLEKLIDQYAAEPFVRYS